MDNKIEDFYNNFADNQKNTGVNDRIFSLYLRAKKFGLNNNSYVLELGCGIGTLTFLLSKTVKKGKIEAVDISSKSIEYAKKRNSGSNIKFSAGDIVNYKPTLNKYDYIILFDVIEHIPVDRHNDLFKNIANCMSNETVLLINIPNPDYIEFEQKNKPENLQVIDQPIQLDLMIDNLKSNNLDLVYFEKYSIWIENDYIFYAITKKNEFNEIYLSKKRSFMQKLRTKFFRTKLKIFYKY